MEQGIQTSGKILKVAVTGPESTGKSTLAKNLAQHYRTLWVPEYAREYLTNLQTDYTFEDVENIAKGQISLEDSLVSQCKEIIFCDTDLINIKIWMEHKFGKAPLWILDEINRRHYHLVLLCNTDIPWEADPLRENPHQRLFFFNWFKRELKNRDFNYSVISGTDNERFKSAKIAVDKILKSID